MSININHANNSISSNNNVITFLGGIYTNNLYFANGNSWPVGGGNASSISITTDTFVANGSGNTFGPLSQTPTNANNVVVNLNGVTQLKSSYTISGANVILSGTPVLNANVDVTVTGLVAGGGGTGNVIYNTTTTATGFLAPPQGTTAQRPATPPLGAMRWNTSLLVFEVYTGGTSGWVAAASQTITPYNINYIIIG